VFAAYNTAGTIGAILSGTGQVHVADGKGQSLATMFSDNGQGALQRAQCERDDNCEAERGELGGVLQLANSGGNAMVDAGVLPSGVGAVRKDRLSGGQDRAIQPDPHGEGRYGNQVNPGVFHKVRAA
jgi:hypothetical protein